MPRGRQMSSFRGRPGHLRAFSRAPPPLAQHPCGRSGGRECSQCAPPACDRQLSCGGCPQPPCRHPTLPVPGGRSPQPTHTPAPWDTHQTERLHHATTADAQLRATSTTTTISAAQPLSVCRPQPQPSAIQSTCLVAHRTIPYLASPRLLLLARLTCHRHRFLPSTSRDPSPSRRGLASQHPSPRPQAFPDARRLRPPQHRPPCLVTSPTNPVVLSVRCFPSRREPDRHLQHTHISTTVQHPPSRSSAETHLFAPSSSATTTVSSPPDRHARLLSHDDAAQQVGFRSSAAPDPLRPQPGPAALEAPPHQRRVRLPMLPYQPMTCPSAPLTCVLRRKSLGRWAVKLTDSLADA